MANICYDCRSETVERAAPQQLDETFGRLHYLVFDPRIRETVCPRCGVVGTIYYRMHDLCEIVTCERRHLRDRRN